MRKYAVQLRMDAVATGPDRIVTVEAEDMELDTADGPTTAFWNFTATPEDEDDAVTVATFPFTDVAYVTSTPK